MKIKFNKKRIAYNLIFSIVFIVLGLYNIFSEHIKWNKSSALIIGSLSLITTIFEIITQYIVINNGTLRKYSFWAFHKDIELQNIIEIKSVADYYILFTETTKLKIQVELIADDSLEDLKRILSELNLPADKTPFQQTYNRQPITDNPITK
jgi:hypothetical protein